MKKYILSRAIKVIFTVWFVWSLIFVLTRFSGDPIEWIFADMDTTEAMINSLKESLGLDLPLWQQYVNSLTGLFKGDAGISYFFSRPVTELFAERIGATVSLGAGALGLAVLIGVPMGILAAMKRGTAYDRVCIGITVIGHTIPNFVLGILLIFIFALKLHLLPSGSTGTWKHYIMPMVTLAMGPLTAIARLTRTALLDVIGQDYLDCARAKGVDERKVIFKHALRNALIPVVTVMAGQVNMLVGGAVIVENVFAWPGLGTLIIKGAQRRDFPVVQYGILMIVIFVSIVNFAVDLSYGSLDPRIRDSRDKS